MHTVGSVKNPTSTFSCTYACRRWFVLCAFANHENLMRKAGTQELNTEGKMPMKLLLISALLRS
jgi:hypothetical protein